MLPTKHTVIVVNFNFVVLSSKDIPCVQPVHEKPCKDSEFVATFRLLDPQEGLWGVYVFVR